MNTAPISPEKKRIVRARYGYRCGYCGIRASITVDHVVARCHDGTNDLHNLMPCCRLCNYIKGSMSLRKFRRIMKSKKMRKARWPKYVEAIDKRYSDFTGRFFYEHYASVDERNYRFYWNRAVKELARMAGL